MFGVKNFGQNWGWTIVGSAFGGLAFQEMSSELYQSKIKEGTTCYGTDCWRTSFIITSAASFIGLILAVINNRRTKRPHQYI